MSRGVKKNKNRMAWLMIFLTILGMVFLGQAIWREIKEKRAIAKEIALLEEQAKKIEKENTELEERVAYLSSVDYQKIQAKEKLNLQSPDENVVVVSTGPTRKEPPAASFSEEIPISEEENLPNFKKWLNFFFAN